MTNISFHAARVHEPGGFDPKSFAAQEIADGVLAVMGTAPGSESLIMQSVRFEAARYTEDEARKWLGDHDLIALKFEPAPVEQKANPAAALDGETPLKCPQCGYEAPRTFWMPKDENILCPKCKTAMAPKDKEAAGEAGPVEKNAQLIEAVRGRKSLGEFGYGIALAGGYVTKALDEIGSGLVDRYCSGTFDREALLKRAERTLTYSDDSLVQEATASPGSFDGMLPDGFRAPPHTLMLIRHTLTSSRKDRDGDTLRSEGAKVDPRGPLLWQHLYNLPLGRHVCVIEQNKQHVKEVSALLDLNDLTEDAAKLVEADALRFSHGFQALDWDEIKSGRPGGEGPAFDVKTFEVMERSLVSIPSNPDAVIELYSRGKLMSEPMQRKAKSLFDARPVSVRPGLDLKAAGAVQTPEASDVQLWNKSLAEPAFVVNDQKLQPQSLLYDWCSKYCGCAIKELTELSDVVRTVRMGAWLTALDDWKAGVEIHDVRNVCGDKPRLATRRSCSTARARTGFSSRRRCFARSTAASSP
jgi:hypothetical protein